MARKAKSTTQGVQRRDANAAARAFAAFDLICEGHTYEEAAQVAGYADRASCWNAVQREMGRMAVEKTDNYRKMHLRRLARLRRVYMPKALEGDGWSADRVLKFDEREAALMGLDTQPEPATASGSVSIEMVQPLNAALHGIALPEPAPTAEAAQE